MIKYRKINTLVEGQQKMGDRSTIRIITQKRNNTFSGIESYSHGGGLESIENTIRALNTADVYDIPYTTRQLSVTHQDGNMEVTGGGYDIFTTPEHEVFTFINENSYPDIVVNLPEETVSVRFSLYGNPATMKNYAITPESIEEAIKDIREHMNKAN